MFPEYQQLIDTLKSTDADFLRLCNDHNELDKKITAIEKHLSSDSNPELKRLKQQKLHLKEEIEQILKSYGK